MTPDIYKLNEDPELIFTVDIQGAPKKHNAKAILSIMIEDKQIAYTGEFNGNSVKFKLKDLKKYFTEGTFTYNLEVFIEDRHFTPYTGELILEHDMAVTAKPIVESPEIVSETLSISPTVTPSESESLINQDKPKYIRKIKNNSNAAAAIAITPGQILYQKYISAIEKNK